jgi:CsoR family transcriptional regulator, copper-sensing transcriptional repressor
VLPDRDTGYNNIVVKRLSPDDAEHAVSNGTARKSVAVDSDIKSSNLKRLKRIEGQIRGLQKMVDEERYCADILVQISSVQEALRGVSQALLRNHLRHCVTSTLQKGKPAESERMYSELSDLFSRYSR